MEDLNFRKGDAKTEVFGSNRMLQPSPVEKIPDGPTTPEIAYQMVKDETFAQTQPRLNLATFVTTYMDEYATKLMNEAININYIDETEYPRIAVMENRRTCHRFLGGMYAGWCGSLVALAQETSGTRQTVRQTQLRYFNRFPGGMGKIRPIVAD